MIRDNDLCRNLRISIDKLLKWIGTKKKKMNWSLVNLVDIKKPTYKNELCDYIPQQSVKNENLES